jgi:hypothetical protein
VTDHLEFVLDRGGAAAAVGGGAVVEVSAPVAVCWDGWCRDGRAICPISLGL